MVKIEIKKVKVNTRVIDGRVVEMGKPLLVGVFTEESTPTGAKDMNSFIREFIDRLSVKIRNQNKEEEYRVLREGGGFMEKLIINRIIN